MPFIYLAFLRNQGSGNSANGSYGYGYGGGSATSSSYGHSSARIWYVLSNMHFSFETNSIHLIFETKFEYIRPVWNMYLGGFDPETYSSSSIQFNSIYFQYRNDQKAEENDLEWLQRIQTFIAAGKNNYS